MMNNRKNKKEKMSDNNEVQNKETEQPVTRSSSQKNFLKKYGTLDTLKIAGIVLVIFIVMPYAAFACTHQPEICRFAEIFLPVGVALFGCGYALKRKADSRSWRETTAIFAGYAILLASLFLTFKFSENDYFYYNNLSIYIGEGLMVLIMIVMRSAVMPLIMLPLSIWTDAEVSDGFILLTIIILYVFYLYFIKKERFLCKLWIGILPFAISLDILILISHSNVNVDVIIAFLFSSLSYTIHLWIKGNININSNATGFKIFSYLLFAILLFFIGFHWERFTDWGLPFQACVVTALLIIIALIIKIWKKKKIECLEWITLPIVAILYFSGDYQEIAASILFIAIIEFTIYDNYIKEDPVGLSCGICLQFWWIAVVLKRAWIGGDYIPLIHDILISLPIIGSTIMGIHIHRKLAIKKAKSSEPTFN